ncbi:radical SAM family heme chaperone HemW [Mucilaginibacter phyllosphaerae]|uniref:Heme chaperone HemW n=1 Tax=Mucilaginibacter phyllosphaerae TaxID=1812349 RepID=A0A4Y8AKD7_9SPHI|nr:radical SAM family heme chaperone HemW [Mucilaginibacter phyllosphaerae]MBB3967446.1 oxygen-independent coproporphyrinogen-3 oxidase [Mucilaginibacter phyllosphaerae]TEW69486.1 radical SAM family heme chaperone HemW [Mucilaginibacter phyllosphaerae]GGH20748.1 coproporphyrinogen III oxidase [Mucilaginibacter phyllosphaerae]
MAGIYIHIPFCKQACHYCDFHFSTSAKYKDEMVDALVKEVSLQKGYLGNETVETIYFGGGTPSVLSADEIIRIINTITELHTVTADAEITLEANPDDLDRQKINALRHTPVNRFSIGIQSFFDEDLQWMNRVHRAKEAEASIKRAQDAGFENITADLIYGYPLLTDTKWKQNLYKIFELGIPHISAYSMTVEPQTALAAFISKKKQAPMNEGQSANQFNLMLDAMQSNGFEQYEISNFCRPGHYSRHNSNYWRGVKYLGIGPSAHSFNGDNRQWNIANNAKYISSVNLNTIPAEIEILTETNRLNEYIMTALRTIWGLDLDKLNSIAPGASNEVLKAAKPYFEDGSLLQNDHILTLSPKGKLYADIITSNIFF